MNSRQSHIQSLASVPQDLDTQLTTYAEPRKQCIFGNQQEIAANIREPVQNAFTLYCGAAEAEDINWSLAGLIARLECQKREHSNCHTEFDEYMETKDREISDLTNSNQRLTTVEVRQRQTIDRMQRSHEETKADQEQTAKENKAYISMLKHTMNREKVHWDDEKTRLQCTLASKDDTITGLKAELVDVKVDQAKKSRQYKLRVATKDETIKDLKNNVSDQHQTIESNKTELQDLESKLDQECLASRSTTSLLEAAKSLRVTAEQQHRNEIDAKDSEIKRLTDLLSAKNQDVTRLSNDLSGHKSWVKRLQREKRKDDKKRETEVKQHAAILASKTDEITDLEKQVSQQTDTLSAKDSEVVSLRAQVTAQQALIDSSETDIKDFKHAIAGKSEQIANLMTQIETMQSKFEKYQGAAAAREKEVTDLKERIDTADAEVESLKQAIVAKETEISVLKKQRDTEIQAKQRQQTAADLKLRELEKRHAEADEQLRKQMFPFTF
ncbi:MAG: hypothetical protein Q9168_007044 [Polycauliona sp. 1 TL-2023]